MVAHPRLQDIVHCGDRNQKGMLLHQILVYISGIKKAVVHAYPSLAKSSLTMCVGGAHAENLPVVGVYATFLHVFHSLGK